MYFDELIRITTSIGLEDTMHQHVVGPTTFKTMMHMLSGELDKRTKPMYPDATEARVCFQQDVTIECTDIRDYQAWHRFVTVDHREDVEELASHNYLSLSDALHGLLKPILSHMGTCAYCNVTCCKSERLSDSSRM